MHHKHTNDPQKLIHAAAMTSCSYKRQKTFSVETAAKKVNFPHLFFPLKKLTVASPPACISKAPHDFAVKNTKLPFSSLDLFGNDLSTTYNYMVRT